MHVEDRSQTRSQDKIAKRQAPPRSMLDSSLSEKEFYFQQQDLLHLSGDDEDASNESLRIIDDALAESRTMLPPSNIRRPGSFNGPTPKEMQARAEFEDHTTERRTNTRNIGQLTRSSTLPGLETATSFPITKSRLPSSSNIHNETRKLKRVSPLPEVDVKIQVPFYKQVGVIPRDLKNGKNVKPADSIKLEPESKQLLRHKVVYFYPNDDVSMIRRTRLHKIIQLGAAWVKTWREDVTHVMVDDANHTYGQLLRHLNRAGFPVSPLAGVATFSG
jgi:DNA polymerase IV